MLVPLLSLVSVWALATAVTVGDAMRLRTAAAASDAVAGPAEDLLRAIQAERRHALLLLGDPRRADTISGLQDSQEATDEAAGEVWAGEAEARDDLTDGAKAALDSLTTALDDLRTLREQVRSNTISLTDALAAYGTITEPSLRLMASVQPVTDAEVDRHGRALAGIAEARELLSAEDALAAGALAADRITGEELNTLEELMLKRDLAYAAHLPELPVDDRLSHDSFWDSGNGRVLGDAEQTLLDSGVGNMAPEQWDEASGEALASLAQYEADARDRYQSRVDSARGSATTRAAVVGVGGLLALLLSGAVAFRLGRRHLRELRTLSREATDAAEVRLPGVMRRLAAGERVDVETEAPRLEYGPDELGRVGQALNTLQRAAVAASVERSATRHGVAEVFVNLARRSQVLLHRQLHLVETIERRTETRGDAADLIRLGHLTTRMRRHAEGLVVLSGAAPARQWGKPERLMDVVRAAVDEVEDFERVELRRLPPLTVAGSAVPDLTHLIAELLENATVFSPPHTAVQVSGERVPHGFTLEIHDRGLGLTADALQEANQRLSRSAEFELTDTDRLGLFVVSRLAERHGMRVALKDSPYGGTTAVALIPGDLLSEAEEIDELPERGAPPTELNGPVDGPVELEAPPPVTHPGHTSGTGRPADADDHTSPREQDAPIPLPPRRPHPVLVTDHGRPVGPPRGPAATPADAGAPGAPGAGDAPGGRDQHRGEAGGERSAGTTSAGLPRRVRRSAHKPATAPGPRDPAPAPAAPASAAAPNGPEGPVGDGPGTDADAEAEAVRARMASLQRGWRRGREQTGSATRQGDTPPGPRP
ncbi:sensor histidine kinase [Streptomyces sp. 6N223]|uniref:sensor histidine kinase n=1 Tax=Streptomyces sp. 6N223 TaxID=3457412 RepID=UPI003FD051B0